MRDRNAGRAPLAAALMRSTLAHVRVALVAGPKRIEEVPQGDWWLAACHGYDIISQTIYSVLLSLSKG